MKKTKKEIKVFRRVQLSLDQVVVRAETLRLPCEDLEKVVKVLTNVLEGEVKMAEVEDGCCLLSVECRGRESVERIFQGFRKRLVLSSVRKHLKSSTTGNKMTFMLNKQAAFVGVMAISEEGESVQGGVNVTMESPNLREMIDWLTRF